MKSAIASNELTVCFWNILFQASDSKLIKPQVQRLGGIIGSLQKLPKDTIIGLAEVEESNRGAIVQGLGCRSEFFVEHHKPRDYIGVISREKLQPRYIQIGENCRAILLDYKGINIAVVHITRTDFQDKIHKKQIRALLSNLSPSSPSIIVGDFNSLSWQGSRKILNRNGYQSVFKRTLLKRVPTAPTKQYNKLYPWYFRTFSWLGFSLDDIYVKGVDVLAKGTFDGESDHRAVWAKLSLNPVP